MLFVAVFAAILSVSLSYIIAGQIWVERHSLTLKSGSKAYRVSGVFGEIFIVAIAAAMVLIIDIATNGISVDQIVSSYRNQVLGILCVVAVVVYVHGIRTALAASEGQRARLIATYLVYGIYSTLVFAGGGVLVFLIIFQIVVDAATFEAAAQPILQSLTQAPDVTSLEFQRALELSYMDAQTLLSSIEGSMAPVFIFMAGIFAINLAILLTPLRGLFVDNAVLLTLVSIIGLISVLVASAWIYAEQYSAFIENYLGAMEAIKPGLSDTRFTGEVISRFSEIYLNMLQEKTPIGFITRMANEWGGLAAILGLAQWLVKQFGRPESSESPAHT